MRRGLAKAALSLIGAPFRLHGRDPETGLDCVGLVAEAMRRTGRSPQVPEGYSLRSVSVARFLECAEASGLKRCRKGGHVLLCMVSPVQPHLLLAVPGGYVHAHASLGRVTLLPAPLPWPVTLQWRLARKGD